MRSKVARSDGNGQSQAPQDVGRVADTGLTFFVYHGHAIINNLLSQSGDL